VASRRTSSLVVATLCVVGLFSGCAGARPGVAAQVGTTRVTLATVDDATADLCSAFLPQFEESGATYPLNVLSGFVVGSLTRQAMAEQVAAEYGVEPSPTYDEQVAAAENAAEEIPEDLRANYLELSTAGPYADSIMQQAGRQALEEEGAASDDLEVQTARGREIFADWVDENTVVIDPRYGLAVIEGDLAPADTDVSVPVSPAALAGAAEQMDPALAAALPESQRCN
jgi:hypothetical protein